MQTSIGPLAPFVRFIRVARLLLWTLWVIYRERKRVIRARQRGDYEVKPDIEVLIAVLTNFKRTALRLGVLTIKLGQFLSSRADILPEQALAVLSTLQDEVPPAPFEHVVATIEKEFGRPVNEIFSVLEQKCTAAASLGQVHKAVLAATGETVAVKIQRPHIEQLVRLDLRTLKFVIWLINRFVDTKDFIDLGSVYREFRRTVFEEVDFKIEAANAERFREMFADDPTIYVPKVYAEYVSRHVLVLEWIDGIKVNDYAALDLAGIDRLEVANRTIRAYFYQFFAAGFYHADPHPGNIFVKRGCDPANPIVAFVDFGMVGSITRTMKRLMRSLFLSLVTQDSEGMVQALNQLGFIGERADLKMIEDALGLLLEQYYGMTLGQVRDLDMRSVVREVSDLLYDQPFRIPAQFAFSGRAVSTLVGVATGLAPDFNFVAVATPYAQSFLGLDMNNLRESAQQLLKQTLDMGKVLLKLPHSIDRLVTRIDAGQVEVRLANLAGSGSHIRRGKAGGQLVLSAGRGSIGFTLLGLASMAGGIYLLTSHLPAPGWFCLGLAAITTLGLFVKR
ncbi:ABC1 kinase family protein [Tengunoibacter tsumagoiensis]|uniref:ABC transporter n=1 Tax=Tengunoibacter tsumagoiensis TaxID=2014871 RepID=A0A401ZTF7_9CHLR|nr:AarF/ABC1/UbiB kinase family protein [Tengunoibacter tsumagoiensis]GCE10165.1 ABC transporter [Tengunoibacter tsumagoiensis]